MKSKTLVYGLIGILWLAAIFDLVSFFVGNLSKFETNPLFLITGNIALLLLVKFIVNGGITYLLLKYKPTKSHRWAFIFIMITLVCIIGQGLGGVSNVRMKVAYDNTVGTPNEIQPMEPEVAGKSYIMASFILLYYPLILGFIAFSIYEKLWRRK